jgi:hypothetical protein
MSAPTRRRNMKKVLLSLLFVCALSPAALAGDKVKIDDHSKDVIVTCPDIVVPDYPVVCAEAPACVCPPQITAEDLTVAVTAAVAATECPKVECPESGLTEGIYNVCRYRTNGTRKCKRIGIYKLYAESVVQ